MAEDRVVEFSEGVSVSAPDDSQPLSVDHILVSEISTPSTPASGKMAIYAKTDQKLYTKDDAGTEKEVGSGSGGDADQIDILSADDATDTSGWDTTGQNATFDNGGTITASSLTLDTTAANLLSGTTNVFSYDPDANGQNDFFARTITVPKGWRGRYLGVKFLYKTDSTYTDEDFDLVIKDDTNATILQTEAIDKRDVTDDTGADYVTNFYCPSDCAALVIGFQNTSTTTTIEFYVDRFELTASPFVISDFDNLTDWESWTPTGSWSTNTTYTGFKKQVGDEMHYHVHVALSGAPTAANLSITLPTGDVIDTTKLGSTTQYFQRIKGHVLLRDNGTANWTGVLEYINTTTVEVWTENSTAGQESNVNQTSPFTFANGDAISIFFEVPIVGLSSKTEHVVTPTRIAQPSLLTTVDATVWTTGTVEYLGWDTTVSDEDGLFSGVGNSTTDVSQSATIWTAPHDGFWDCRAAVLTGDGGLDADERFGIRVYVNSTLIYFQDGTHTGSAPTSVTLTAAFSRVLKLNSGDIVEIAGFQTSGGNLTPTNAANSSFWSMTQIDTVPVLGAIPRKIYVQAEDNGGQSLTANVTDITWSTEVSDLTGSWSGSVFTAPESGVYAFSGGMYTTASTSRTIVVADDGTNSFYANRNQANQVWCFFSGQVYLSKSQTLSFRSGSSETLSSNTDYHTIFISRTSL